MTKIMTSTQAKKEIDNLIDETSLTHKPIIIKGKTNSVVMLCEEDYKAIQETIYLNSIPNMANSIQETMNAPDSDFSEYIQW